MKASGNLNKMTVDDMLKSSRFVYPLKPNLQYEDFTWEARGVRGTKDTLTVRVKKQTGTFTAAPGETGEEGFKIPFATTPHVELVGTSNGLGSGAIMVNELRASGFKWKVVSKDTTSGTLTVTWKAEGVLATEISKTKPD